MLFISHLKHGHQNALCAPLFLIIQPFGIQFVCPKVCMPRPLLLMRPSSRFLLFTFSFSEMTTGISLLGRTHQRGIPCLCKVF